MLSLRWSPLLVCFFVCLLVVPTWAAPVTARIAAEIKTGEVDDDLRFANAQGTSNGDFTAYAVYEFDSTGLDLSSVPALKFSLTQANAFFTSNGPIEIFITDDVTTDLTGGVAELRSDPAAAPNGIAPGSIGNLTSLGTGEFVEVETGHVDMFTFPVDDTVAAYLANQGASNGPLRFLMAAAGPDTSATYRGVDVGDSGLSPPQLEVVPEPASGLLAMMAGLFLAGIRRRR